jgi:hypothetical protein
MQLVKIIIIMKIMAGGITVKLVIKRFFLIVLVFKGKEILFHIFSQSSYFCFHKNIVTHLCMQQSNDEFCIKITLLCAEMSGF